MDTTLEEKDHSQLTQNQTATATDDNRSSEVENDIPSENSDAEPTLDAIDDNRPSEVENYIPS